MRPTDLKKGSAELLILSLLEKEPRHGYDLCKLIEARSNGAVLFKVASLYPLLYRLERRGWIQGRWVEKAGQRRRRYYRLTTEGKKILAAQLVSWAEIVEELSQHLDDRYEASVRGGATEDEAYGAALLELNEGDLLAQELGGVE